MEKQTAWKVKVIVSIGKFLCGLPPARELYRHLEYTTEETAQQEHERQHEEEDIFGHMAAGLDDNPEGYQEQGLFDRGDVKQNGWAVERGNTWRWTGRCWQCLDCFKQVKDRSKQSECMGVPPSIATALTLGRNREHKLHVAVDAKECWVCWCNACGCWASHKAIKLKQSCRTPNKQGKIVLSRVRKNLHPDGSRTLLSMQTPVYLRP